MKKIFLTSLFFFAFAFSQEESGFSINSKSTVFRAISESNTEFEMKKSDSASIDSLVTRIDLYRDSETQRQWAGFSIDGNKTNNGRKINIGGEWNIPVFLYKNSGENSFIGDSIAANTISYQAAAVSLGFVLKNTNENFPFKFSAGPSFEGGIRQQERDTVFGAGGYFSIIGGDTLGSRISESPFLFGAEIFGRYIKSEQDNRNTAAKSVLIYDKNGVFSTDTLAIFVNNSIGLGEVNSQFAYTNSIENREIPSKYSNNLKIVLRATEIGNAFFEPSFEFSLSDNRYRYLNTDKFYGSLKKNTISGLAFLNKGFGNWDFETGIRFTGIREENLYFSGNTGGATASDALNEKLKNANVFNPQYYFLTEFLSPNEIMLLSARFVVERNRRLFPFYYEQNEVKITNGGDFDNVSQQIKLQSDFYLTDWYNLYASVERLKYQIYFLKSKMSAASRTEERYALELGNIFSRDSTIIFSLRGIAVAAPQKYLFPDFEGVSLPFHNRLFGLYSDLVLGYSNGWSNNLGFSIAKFDRGRIIYDENYYGIEMKKREIIPSISVSKTTRLFVLSCGLEANINKIDDFDYDGNNYQSNGYSYVLLPFTSGNFVLKDDFTLDFYAKRNINKGYSTAKDFWEVSLNLSAYF